MGYGPEAPLPRPNFIPLIKQLTSFRLPCSFIVLFERNEPLNEELSLMKFVEGRNGVERERVKVDERERNDEFGGPETYNHSTRSHQFY